LRLHLGQPCFGGHVHSHPIAVDNMIRSAGKKHPACSDYARRQHDDFARMLISKTGLAPWMRTVTSAGSGRAALLPSAREERACCVGNLRAACPAPTHTPRDQARHSVHRRWCESATHSPVAIHAEDVRPGPRRASPTRSGLSRFSTKTRSAAAAQTFVSAGLVVSE
jgi:hypothetical protein